VLTLRDRRFEANHEEWPLGGLLAYAEHWGKALASRGRSSGIANACWLHDIRKNCGADNILLKPGPLDAEEMRIVRQHPSSEKKCAHLSSRFAASFQ